MTASTAALALVATSLLSGFNSSPTSVDDIVNEVKETKARVAQEEREVRSSENNSSSSDSKVERSNERVSRNSTSNSEVPATDLRTGNGETSSVTSQSSSPSRSNAQPTVGDTDKWDRLAECEAGGDWSINTGNGFSGGLQFTPQTWSGFGGNEYAPEAHMATREQQIAIAEKVEAGQGMGAWPACSAKLGYL